MKTKTNIILLTVLCLQAVLIAYLYWPSTEESLEATRFFKDFPPELITRLSISDGEQKNLVLEKDDKGNWQVTDSALTSYPADPAKLERLLATLTSLQSKRLVTQTTSSHIRLQVDDTLFARKVSLAAGNGAQQTIFLGSSAGQQAVHVRAAGHDKVYLVKGLSSWELSTDIESWWQQNYVQVDDTTLSRFSLKNGNGSFVLEKKDDHWQFAGDDAGLEEIDQQTLKDLLHKAAHITLAEYLGKENDTAPLDLVSYQLVTDKETISIKVGPTNNDNKHVIKSSASPFFATVNTYILEPLADITKEKLLKKDEKRPADDSREGTTE